MLSFFHQKQNGFAWMREETNQAFKPNSLLAKNGWRMSCDQNSVKSTIPLFMLGPILRW